MKVLLHADAVGGVFTYALELAGALLRRGVEVVLATEGARLRADQRQAVAALPGLVHRGAEFRLEWMDDPWDDVARAGGWLLSLERRERPDVVHLSGFSHGALAFRAPRLVVAHSCVLSWFEAVRGHPAPASWDRYRAQVGAGLRAADALAAPTRAMAEAVVRLHGPVARPRVVWNGRDPARVPPGSKLPLVLGAGRLWDEAKNAAALLRVAPRVPWPVAVAGPVPDPPPPGASMHPGASPEALGVGRAHLVGWLSEPELARWLARAAVFAHPARYEPFGLAVLEAALAGCALVLGDIESLRELWDGAAVFVAPGDDGALSAALRRLADDARARDALAAAARARALRLGPDRMAEGYLALYGSLLEGGREARP